jgi:hypothetical protein
MKPAADVAAVADAVIPKPFELDLLRSTVDRLVSQGSARR